MKENRRQQVLKRKNFLPSLIATLVLWAILALTIYFLDPFTVGALPLFFILVFFCLLFTSSLLFGNTRRGLVLTFALTIFLFLRYLGVGNLLNFILIAGLSLTIELYLARK